MKRPRRPAAALAGLAMCLVGAVIGLPLLAMGAGAVDDPTANPCLATPPAGATPIQGAATLTAAQIAAWWDAANGGQPPRLGLPVDDVIHLYLTEAAAEDVAGDLAFAQAVHETGWFTNSDTARNNFAGIAHPDGTAAAQADTWEALTGTWATDPGYWTAISHLYADMLAGTDADPPPTQPALQDC